MCVGCCSCNEVDIQILGCMLIVGYSCEGHIFNANVMLDNALSRLLDL